MDASNIIKPALSGAKCSALGDDVKQYRKGTSKKDAALERRFQAVKVEAPSVDEAILICRASSRSTKTIHKVDFTDKAIDSSVRLSDRYLTGRFYRTKPLM